MLDSDVFSIANAIEFVGEDNTYQTRRLVAITVALVSLNALSSFLTIDIPEQSNLHLQTALMGYTLGPYFFQLPALMHATLGFLIFTFIAVNWVPFLAYLVYSGLVFFWNALQTSSFVYVNEIGGNKWRAWGILTMATLINPLAFTISEGVPVLLWIVLLFVIQLISNAYIMVKCQNSPYFYCEIAGDFNAARTVLNIMARQNSRPEFLGTLEGEFNDPSSNVPRLPTFQEVCLEARQRLTFPIAVIWFCVFYTLTTIPTLLVDVKGNPVHLAWIAAIEPLAMFTSIPILREAERKIYLYSITVLILVVSLFESLVQILQECAAEDKSCSKRFISFTSALVLLFSAIMLRNVLMIYTVELLPTKIRKMGFGVYMIIGGIGGAISPFISILLLIFELSPLISLPAMSLPVLYTIQFLQETHGKLNHKRPAEIRTNEQQAQAPNTQQNLT